MEEENIKDINFIDRTLREFYTKNKEVRGSGFGKRLIMLYTKFQQSEKLKEQHRNTRHQAAELAVKDSDLHRDIMNLEQIKPEQS